MRCIHEILIHWWSHEILNVSFAEDIQPIFILMIWYGIIVRFFLNFSAVSESRAYVSSYWIIPITWQHFLECDRMSESSIPPTESESIFRSRFIAFIVIAARLGCHSMDSEFLHFLPPREFFSFSVDLYRSKRREFYLFYFILFCFFLTLELKFCSIFCREVEKQNKCANIKRIKKKGYEIG